MTSLGERWLKWFRLVAHSRDAFSQHLIYTLVEGAGKGRGWQDDIETSDRE